MEHIADFKFGILKPMILHCNTTFSASAGTNGSNGSNHSNGGLLPGWEGCLVKPWLTWTAMNLLLMGLVTTVVVYAAPAAAGSGIPEIKVRTPRKKRKEDDEGG